MADTNNSSTAAEDSNPILRHARDQEIDRFGARLIDKTQQWQDQFQASKPEKQNTSDTTKSKKGPPGGFDATPVPDAPPGYTLRVTFVRADNLPYADLGTLSADPYIIATLKTSLPKRHKEDSPLRIRIPTVHRNTNPVWNAEWVIANVPASGFYLKCRLYDEDPADHDDRLGNVHINVPAIHNDWTGFKEQTYELKKRMGSKRAYTFRGCAAMFSRSVKFSGSLVVTIENLGPTQDENGGRAYTVAPLAWSQHYSPLIGRLTGTKERDEDKDGKPGVDRYNFQAIQMQLKGPVPAELYHRYVEFKPFVAGMFTDKSLRGRILNRALHHQHARIYNYDKSTVYGKYEEPCPEMTKKFLEFCHWDQGGRIFTYVLTLDGHFRFTETGKEFGIDLLSKHTMHSDVSIYIAFSGEFFIRRLRHPHGRRPESGNSGEAVDDLLPPEDDHVEEERSRNKNLKFQDPKYYELVIDNDSGTYRPNAKMLSKLKGFFAQNLPGLKVATLDCQADEEKMNKLKDEQREKKKHTGAHITYLQNSSMSSISSSEEEELNNRADGQVKEPKYKHEYHKYMGRGEDKHHGDGSAAKSDTNAGEKGSNGSASPASPTNEKAVESADDGDTQTNVDESNKSDEKSSNPLIHPWKSGAQHLTVNGVVGKHAQKQAKEEGEARGEALNDHYEKQDEKSSTPS
ncbi:uncharacterized protein HMPREF1541_06670 [Cyphellophora europaea CBS 101466]|uniref:C2 domain-containing protein n=1 Tax=Cyphellophora europaea (strain CBS 101466) TaxID=1220924 RepID=W2RSB1_CYPE1|nr:uncharacterized protein HMPREF1541_06670 [Cyphellophora europaea CBS 101466]ETN38633.1 hypothetical protein HMPREF1541_06670 [Cyphellophora europaea CBS 101466]